MTIHWGMIGTGDVTELKSGPAFSKIDGSVLHAVANRTPEKAKDYARRHCIARYYPDPMDVIRDPEVDVVYVATPPDVHSDYALACIEAGKPVYLEKPMARTFAECQLINDAASKAGVKVWVAYYRRSLEYFLKVKELIGEGTLGRIKDLRMEQLFPARHEDLAPGKHPWRVIPEISGGGYFHDMGCHALDIVFDIFGDPQKVEGMSQNLGKLYEADDTVDAIISLPGDVALKANWSFVAREGKDRVEILGKNGNLSFSIFSFEPIRLSLSSEEKSYDFERPAHIQQDHIQSIVDELHGRGLCPSTGENAATTSLVMDHLCS